MPRAIAFVPLLAALLAAGTGPLSPEAAAAGDAAGAALPPPPAVPASCAAPSGDTAWQQCLDDLSAQLDAARVALQSDALDASAELPADGETALQEDIARSRAVAERNVTLLDTRLREYVARARHEGVSEAVLEAWDTPPPLEP